MDWQPYTVRFNQVFIDGYRYLDRCGKFMLAAVEKYDFLPGELKPTGAQLALPERGIRALVDSTSLEITQERPIEAQEFLSLSAGMAGLARTLFEPMRVEQTLFEYKLLIPMETEAAAEEAMLTVRGQDYQGLAKEFDMIPRSRRLDTRFASGSQRLQVMVYPVTFETVRVHRHNPNLGATKSQARRAKRLTAAADRMPSYTPYAIFLEIIMVEYEPPLGGEENLFGLMLDKTDVAKRLYALA